MSTPGRPIRLLIVDDHPVVRDGLRGVFTGDPDFEVVGEAADGAEAVAMVERLGADKTHLLHIYDKLGVRDRAGAVGEAYKRRLLP